MPLDHYISQVYLRGFHSPNLGRLHAVRKADLKVFTPRAEDICRIESGNTNPYLQEPRAIEEFLRDIEPRYPSVLRRLRAKEIDRECVYVIAGFLSYFLVCSPGGMRLRSEPLKPILTETARRLDKAGKFPSSPPGLGGRSLPELIDTGVIEIKINEKYPQAMGIAAIGQHIHGFGNFTWDILINPFSNAPFFTSDYPIALEPSGHPQIMNKLIPLSPDLAVRIHPQLRPPPEKKDFSFPQFRYAFTKLGRSAIGTINSAIVRCAETTVFHRDDELTIFEFIKRHANFRIESRTERISTDESTFLISTERISAIAAPKQT